MGRGVVPGAFRGAVSALNGTLPQGCVADSLCISEFVREKQKQIVADTQVSSV